MKRNKTIYSIFFILFMIYALTLLIPFCYILLNSFKSDFEFSENIWAFPKELIEQGNILINYLNAFKNWQIGEMFINSIIITAGGTFFGVVSPMVVAYVLAKYKFKLNGLIFSIALVFMVIPNLFSTAATYNLLYKFRLLNSYLGLFLLYAAPFSTYFFILYSFFKGISWSYAEAAYIDGAGELTVFLKVMMPQAVPGIVAVLVMQCIGVYNDYFYPYMYMPNAYTVATGLQNISFNAETRGEYVSLFSAIIVASIPSVVLFIFAQKTVMNNVTMGGLKG